MRIIGFRTMTDADPSHESRRLDASANPRDGRRTAAVIVNELLDGYRPTQGHGLTQSDRPVAPFLSVLMRTQGKRSATIQEALLGLAAQSSQNFEVLVLAHNVSPDELENLRQLTDSFGASFSGQVRIYPIDGGGRSRPLNMGIDLARGQYVAILDDDDIVFGHWVETFERFSSLASGGIIRCIPSEQSIKPATWPGGRAGYTITSRPRCPWPKQFDLLDHLLENRTPPCSFALPRDAFTDLGIRFDESLPVLEDWDVLLQIAMLNGVTDTGEVTALWRKWDRGDSSTFVHSHSEWRQARRTVISKLNSRPLLLPAGSVIRLQGLVASADRVRMTKNRILGRLSAPGRIARRVRRRLLSRMTL